MKEKPRVALHGATDVGKDDERPRFLAWFAVCERQHLTPVTQTLTKSTPEVEAGSMPGAVATRDALAQLPHQLGDEPSYFFELLVTQIGKITFPERITFAVGLGQLDDLDCFGVVGRRGLGPHIGRHDQRFRTLSADGTTLQLHEFPLAERFLPEHIERFIEKRDIVATMDEQRARGVVEVGANTDVDVRERLHEIDHPTRIDVESEPSKHAPE
jgi:hypothetical protein